MTVCSHLGRPKGEDPKLSLSLSKNACGRCCRTTAAVLENTRFNPGETKNDPEFARELADANDLFVEDAFGSVHRAHASTVGVAEILPAYAGLLLERELAELGKLLGEVERPFVLISGGAKVDDKLGVLQNLGGKADACRRRKMAEQIRTRIHWLSGRPPGRRRRSARRSTEDAETSGALRRSPGRLARARHRAGDARALRGQIRKRARSSGTGRWVSSSGRASPRARRRWRKRWPPREAYSVVGGAESAAGADRARPRRQGLWLSTGGGAALELLEGKELPGVAVIPERRAEADRRQLEDVQGPGGAAEFCLGFASRTSQASTSSSARRTSRSRSQSNCSPAPRSRLPPRTCTGSRKARTPARSRRDAARARRIRGDRRPLGAPAVLRRDRRDSRATGTGRARRRGCS